MKWKLRYAVFILCMTGCAERTSQNPSSEQAEVGNSAQSYMLIRDDLYRNSAGKLFFKVTDRSAADNPKDPGQGVKINYIDYLRLDTIVDGETTYVTSKLSEVVDAETFREVDVLHSIHYRVFQDKNYQYVLIPQADGGVLHAVQ